MPTSSYSADIVHEISIVLEQFHAQSTRVFYRMKIIQRYLNPWSQDPSFFTEVILS